MLSGGMPGEPKDANSGVDGRPNEEMGAYSGLLLLACM
jgi:hypothetical protein